MKSITIYLRDKNGNIFVQKSSVDNLKKVKDSILENDVFNSKPRHLIICSNLFSNPLSERYKNGIKISKKVAKKYGFKYKSIKKLNESIDKFIGKKIDLLGECHPISSFSNKTEYNIFVDQKKERIQKDWKKSDSKEIKLKFIPSKLKSITELELTKFKEKIKERAKKIYYDSNCIEGRDIENWNQAEIDITKEYIENEK